MFYFNPLDEFFKNPIGAVCESQEATFRVKCSFKQCVLVLHKDNSPCDECYLMTKKDGYFEKSIKLEPGLYWYYFDVGNGRFIGLSHDKEYKGELSNSPQGFQLTVYSDGYYVPEWLDGGIIYQIFPDRFNRAEEVKNLPEEKVLHENWLDTPIFKPNFKGQVLNNDFFGGDFRGIIAKLDYLKSLSVKAIYLNPIFKAYSNHRYDTGDYMTIDPLLGTEEDFEELIAKANEVGIKIILDGVFNHTGDDSLYFNKYGRYGDVGAYKSAVSPYKSWYKFISYPDEYESWWGIKTLPAVNKSMDSGFIKFITGPDGVIEKYTKKGIGGWRLDVVDELPSHFVKKIRQTVKNINNNAIIIGEVWEDASNKVSYGVRRQYFQGSELDSVMNYPLKNAILDYVTTGHVESISYVVKEQIDHYPKIALDTLMNILSTHDTYRLISAVSSLKVNGLPKAKLAEITIPKEKLAEAKFNLKVASLLQFTLCGVPCIYYGDEIGMQGYTDPLNRKCYPWGNEDMEILEWYRLLGKIRTDYSAFCGGNFKEICAEHGTYAYKRYDDCSEVFVGINIGEMRKELHFAGELKNLLDGKIYKNVFQFSPNTMCVLVKEK